MRELIGQLVMNRRTGKRGIITKIEGSKLLVTCSDGSQVAYQFPAAFADTLLLADRILEENLGIFSSEANFDNFKVLYKTAINSEIDYLKKNGGKKYRVSDGECLKVDGSLYIYAFDTDSELYFPDGTDIKLWMKGSTIFAKIIYCEEFTIVIQTTEFLGEKVETIEFTAEPWQLLNMLIERIDEIDATTSSIAYKLACKGSSNIDLKTVVEVGQDAGLMKVSIQPITFIWGPPGTGKTTTLAKIALEYMAKGKRVLMLSYSNVSVDGALLRVEEMSDYEPGAIIRYGYPRRKELLESKTLTSYSYVLHNNPELEVKYQSLKEERNKLPKKDIQRAELNKQIKKIRDKLLDQEKKLIQNAKFVATTVSKSIVDKAVYEQKFDIVIFDEASMAYIPQIVFAASLAKERFCCLGDLKQLPPVVQSSKNVLLTKDIFDHTGISSAIENGYGHEWLVMLHVQYRMHPSIAKFVSKYMYENMLISAENIYENRKMIAECIPMKGEPMSIIDLSSTYSVCIKTKDGSRVNLMSAMVCIRLAELLVDQYDVGIITPYSAQSRLIFTMIRDLQQKDEKYFGVSCATVHQFQGSEKSIIIYDAVDCFRMAFPGTLLTSQKNRMADRLFNVALTRTQGKFILVANKDYLFRKNISNDLIFTKTLKMMEKMSLCLKNEELLNEIGTEDGEKSDLFLGERDEIDSWERYLQDIENAKSEVYIDIPGMIDDDEDAIEMLGEVMEKAKEKGVFICIRVDENISLPRILKLYEQRVAYVTTPITIIDKEIIWFGQPLSAADFISEGEIIESKIFPCLRFQGRYTAKMIKAVFEIPE